MTELQRPHAELRAAAMVAGKEISKLNFAPWITLCWSYFAASCASRAPSRAKRESPCGSGWTCRREARNCNRDQIYAAPSRVEGRSRLGGPRSLVVWAYRQLPVKL